MRAVIPTTTVAACWGRGWAKQLGVPVWEAPLYHRAPIQPENIQPENDAGSPVHGVQANGEAAMRRQQFICENGSEAAIEIAEPELDRKRAMCAQYASQADILRVFDLRRERLRPQLRYDYTRPPHPGMTNYECWQWWMSADEVSARFAEFLGCESGCESNRFEPRVSSLRVSSLLVSKLSPGLLTSHLTPPRTPGSAAVEPPPAPGRLSVAAGQREPAQAGRSRSCGRSSASWPGAAGRRR